MKSLDRFVVKVSDVAANVATAMLVAMFAINCLDIVGSEFFNHPFPGVVEVTGYLMSMLIPAAAAQVLLEAQHVRIEIVTSRLPASVKSVIDRLISLGLCCLFALISWKMFAYGMDRQKSGEYSDTLQLPFYYVIYFVALAFVPFCLALLRNFLSAAREEGAR